LGRNDRQVPEIILQIYASALCHLNPDAWLDWCVETCQVDGIKDAGETIWGAYLIADLKEYLQMQIDSLNRCIQKADMVPGMEKPVALLKTTVHDLLSLQSCSTWDEISSHPAIQYGTLTFKKDVKGTQLAEQIKAVRNYCKETLPRKLRCFTDSSQDVLGQLQQASLATVGLVSLVKEFRRQYDKVKKSRRVLDFSDIEQKTLDLLRGKTRDVITSAAMEIGARFREIMVDEFQDSNAVQDAIFGALTSRDYNCFMVGDVKQSIYQFRLADPEIFLQKYSEYMPAEHAQCHQGRKVMLTRNFRSSAGVISAVNDVFMTCMSTRVGGLEYTTEEQLVEGNPHCVLPDREVELYGVDVQADTYAEESAFVAQRIHAMLEQGTLIRQGDTLRPVTPDDIVILLRSPNSVGGEFRYALEQWGIPCTSGTDGDLLQAPEIETLLSLLQIIQNPLQDIPLISVLSSPVFCFSADELAQIRSINRRLSFYNALRISPLPKAAAFIDLLTELRNHARFLSITELLHQIFLVTHILSIYGAMEDGDNYNRNLHRFCQVAADYEKTGRRDLGYFLDYMETMKEKGLSAGTPESSGTVRIMSIHKSKGLEFPVVFLCGLSRGFNTADIQKQVLCHKDLGLGLASVNSEQRVRFPTIAKRAIATRISADTVSEELRVLYVA
ncbi:MAG: UvrD-helicase domain-containing protein, partial [Firmicutes bacterium]|nr:UvrD-helicase domain-containing protein [Bacillota bacterium]